ncbi:MAG TPA: tRNA epoxyqueuosine(34) reductase QueG [Longilinea sp.]|nr:tRNA epoxyqueuosine(34) reductase QueG [Longilinea sp.]
MQLSSWIKAEAARLGFPFAGITTLAPPPHLESFLTWIAAGRHASMTYLSVPHNLEKRASPDLILPEAKSILVLGMPFMPSLNGGSSTDSQFGQVASYAWGADYHEIIPPRVVELAGQIGDHLGCQVKHRAYTDTGPILERDFAQRAGLGWAGKNTCLIHPKKGSYFFLAELFIDIELEPDLPFLPDQCGNCRRCIDACPTDCIREDRTLDADLCISYQTIENKGPIPLNLRPKIGNWVFGCDVCQQVCPWNRFATSDEVDPVFQPRAEIFAPELVAEILLDAPAFNQKFRFSPIRRAKRRGYLRNVCIALGNSQDAEALPGLITILRNEPEVLVRGAAAWALGQMGSAKAYTALRDAMPGETDRQVREEISAALQMD